MITKLLNEVNEKIEILNNLIQNKEYFKKLEERIEKVNNYAQEQRKEIERLNNIIKKLERLVDDYAWNSYYIKCGNRYLKSEILNDIREIIELKGVDKE